MLKFHEVSKVFGPVRALDGVSFDCDAGEVVALLGPNGAGKSTAIAIAVGLSAPSEGVVEIETEPGVRHAPADAEARAVIGLASQRLALYPGLSVRENLAFFAAVCGVRRAARGPALRGRIDEALDRVGLTHAADRRVARLSEGTARRVNLAAALIHRPRLVMLDEPTAGLDPVSRRDVHEIVADLRRDACAILYTTHHMDEAERLSDRIVFLREGRVLAAGGVEEIIGRVNGDAAVMGAAARPDRSGGRLEEAFFALAGRGRWEGNGSP